MPNGTIEVTVKNRNDRANMSKKQGGTNLRVGVRSPQRNNVVLEASPSAEIASYDYEAVTSPSECRDTDHDDENEVEVTLVKDCPHLGRCEVTLQDLGKESNNLKTSFAQTIEKLTSDRESIGDPKDQNVARSTCRTTGESKTAAVDLKNSPERVINQRSDAKKHERIPAIARHEKSKQNLQKVKTNLKDSLKRKVVNSSVLDGNRNSKIPRSTKIAGATTKVCPIAQLPSKRNSKKCLPTRPVYIPRRGAKNNFVSVPKEDILRKTYENLRHVHRFQASGVEVKSSALKLSGHLVGLRKEQFADTKIVNKACLEPPRTLVIDAGDNYSPSSKISSQKLLPLRKACRSCNDQRETLNLKLGVREVLQDPWNDVRSAPETRSQVGWPK
ncbi:uncharacterized protein LOC105691314 isoform X2 [Athalia rosae]|nr:uncharacterized protein LOC105691314 isoform X2 [Athalia rosae]